jgi:N-acetyl-1-D-myo-inositol-2-amino-2-deoxy-alpha-D-glucopyranoside deacetylase
VQTVRRDPFDLVGLAVAIVLALVVGGFAAAVTTFVHRQWVLQLGPVPIPLGLIAGLLILLCVTAGFRLTFGRPVALAAGIGAVAAIGVLALPGAGGSAVVLGDALGWTWAIAPVVLAVVVVLWPAARVGRAPARG